MNRTRSTTALAVIFLASGVLHMIRPAVFEQIIPSELPWPRTLVYVSGVAEIACGAGLLTQRRWAPWASVALLIAVFPANVYMAIDYHRDVTRSGWARFATLARLPLQALLIVMALSGHRR